MELSPRSKLVAQLSVLDRAIEKLVHEDDEKRPSVSAHERSPSRSRSVLISAGASLLASASTSKIVTDLAYVGPDESFKIVTMGAQLVSCEYCGEETDIKLLDRHKLMDCKNRLVKCPNHECGLTVHLQSMKWHLKQECVASVTRGKLIEQAKEREARQAAEEAEREAFIARTATLQSLRSVDQAQSVAPPTSSTPRPVSPIRMVMCADCSEQMRESQLTHHLAGECRMRRVMCPNFGFGCKEKAIPLMRVHQHMMTECKAEVNRKAMMAKSKQRLEKIQCATCGEFVALKDWRRHEVELCENRLVPCKNHQFGCQVMVPLKEKAFHEFIDESYARHGVYFNGLGSHLDIAEGDIVYPWTSEVWIHRPVAYESMKMHIITALMLLPAYFLAFSAEVALKDTVLKLVRGLKEDVSKSKEEQLAFAKLSKAERTIWQNDRLQQRMHQVNELTALIPTYSDAVLAYLQAFQAVAICLEAALACVAEWRLEAKFSKEPLPEPVFCCQTEYPGQLGLAGGPANHFAPPTTPANDSELLPPGLGVGRSRSTTLSLESASLDSVQTSRQGDRISNRLQLYASSASEVSKYFERCFYTESLKAIAAAEEAMRALREQEGGEGEGEEEGSVQGSTAAEEIEQRSEREQDSRRSSHSSQRDQRDRGEAAEEVKEEAAVERSAEDELEDALEAEIFKDLAVPGEPPAPVDAQVTWSRFLFDWAVHPKEAIVDHRLTLTEWNSMVLDLVKAVKKDFDRLQDWRIEAGLLTPDVKGGSGFSKKKTTAKGFVSLESLGAEAEAHAPMGPDAEDTDETNDKKEKAARKREKDRQRRETKKLRNQEADEGAEGGDAGTVDGAEGGKRRGSTSVKAATSKEVKLLSRTTELLRSGCGAEIFMDASSTNALGNRSRVCLAMFSGLSILEPVSLVDEEVINHHYDLLLPTKEMAKLVALKGQVGVLCAAADGSAVTEVLGSQAFTFGAKVPRGRWTHLALVTTKQKMSLFVDGKLASSQKDCSIPLPMGALGGSPSSALTFRGVVLDARLWDHQRGGNQIAADMHRLIQMTGDESKAAASGATAVGQKTTKRSKRREDDGLIAWWTFEDGPGLSHVTDITRHRFKTPLSNDLAFEIQCCVAPPGRYPVPYQVLHEVPPGLRAVIPSDTLREIGFAELISDENSDTQRHRSHRFELLRRVLCRWQWIQVETVVTVGGVVDGGAVVPADLAPPSKNKVRPKRKKASSLPDYLAGDEQAGGVGGAEGGRGGVLPIPSFREVNLCPFEIHRLRLAKAGRRLQSVLVCPLGCGEQLRVMDKRYHVRFACPRRFVRCRYDFCGSLFPVADQEHHDREECALVTQRERWLRRAATNSTPVFCHLCSEPVPLRDLQRHQADDCEQRLIFCPYADCALGVHPRPTSTVRGQSDPVPVPDSAGPAEPPAVGSSTLRASPKPALPAHRLTHHLQYECSSGKRQTLFMLVERARERYPYPRPWGMAVELLNASASAPAPSVAPAPA